MNRHLTVDVGNSEIVSVVYQEGRRVASLRIDTRPYPSADELVSMWRELLSTQQPKPIEVALTISSVVPGLEPVLERVKQHFDENRFHRVSWASLHGLSAAPSASRELGSDLIAGLVGARCSVLGPMVVIDCGTATTLTLIDSSDTILGVAIMPGLFTQLTSLTRSAPHLATEIDLRVGPSPYGNDTRESLQSGIVYGHAASLEGLVNRYREIVATETLSVIGCGGLFRRLEPLCPWVDTVDPELVNLGCLELGTRAQKVRSASSSQEGK